MITAGNAGYKKFNIKLGQGADNGCKLRVWHKKQRGKQSARILIKCGDCSNQLEIYYGNDEFLEIGGVGASKKEWAKILLPLLKNGKD
jgi:hypothetical protein